MRSTKNKKQSKFILDKFSKILQLNSSDLQTFFFHSKIYVEGIRESVSEVEKYLKRDARILDIGCGTGLISMLLADLGFSVV